MTSLRARSAALAVALVLPSVVLAGAKFTSTWKAPGASNVRFAGQKVAALIIDADENLRISGEEALARELTARNLQGIAAYRIVPKEELRDKDRAKGWFERGGVRGVVALRVIGDEMRRTYSPMVWGNPYYGSLWDYYAYGWNQVNAMGYVRDDRVTSVETLIFDVPTNTLLWAGVGEIENPKNAQDAIKDLVKAAAKMLKKQGLAGG